MLWPNKLECFFPLQLTFVYHIIPHNSVDTRHTHTLYSVKKITLEKMSVGEVPVDKTSVDDMKCGIGNNPCPDFTVLNRQTDRPAHKQMDV